MIFNKLEIDVTQAAEVDDAIQFAFKYKLPAIVVNQNLIQQAVIAKSRTRGEFKLITPIDWPKGETFGTLKMRNVPREILEADGFEILLTPNKTETETRNEAYAITEFIKTRLSEMAEVRFVISSIRNPNDIDNICKGLTNGNIRTPTLLRTDIVLKTTQTKASLNTHNEICQKITSIIKAPIKISGNINYEIMNKCNANRFAVSLQQAKSIVHDHNHNGQKTI